MEQLNYINEVQWEITQTLSLIKHELITSVKCDIFVTWTNEVQWEITQTLSLMNMNLLQGFLYYKKCDIFVTWTTSSVTSCSAENILKFYHIVQQTNIHVKGIIT